jgi:nucleoside recognition membrane protein YjiH
MKSIMIFDKCLFVKILGVFFFWIYLFMMWPDTQQKRRAEKVVFKKYKNK